MRNFKLTLSYDGTDFHGWQIQPGKPTVQGALTEVLRRITQERVTVQGAGRTDAGVHAHGQVAHFRTGSHLSAEEFQRALNALLPPAVRVVAAEEVAADFHARHQAVAKTYLYRIYRGRVVPPFLHRYVLHYPYALDEDAMRRAAPLFAGEHDFTSFAASSGADVARELALQEEDDTGRTAGHSPVRVVLHSELVCTRDAGRENLLLELSTNGTGAGYELVYLIRGRSFLRYMVRKIVGTLLDVGRGRLAPEDILRLFELRDRSRSGPTVPPHGLCIASVEYNEPAPQPSGSDKP